MVIKKISKGYRLKPKTHNLINKIRKTLKTDIDTVISEACKFYYKELRKNNNGIKIF